MQVVCAYLNASRSNVSVLGLSFQDFMYRWRDLAKRHRAVLFKIEFSAVVVFGAPYRINRPLAEFATMH